MDLPVASPVVAPTFTAALPGWALPRGSEPDALAAAFSAGIALKSLDDLVRAAPAWAGCWRARQALKCAAVAVRLMGRNEDEAALRDAVLLTAAGDDPGPAGKVFSATKRLSTRKPAFSSKAVAELADLLGLSWDDRAGRGCRPRRRRAASWSPGAACRGGPGHGHACGAAGC